MTTRWRTVGWVVFPVAAVLLLSMGGAIAAAPVTVPLMAAAVRHHPTGRFRAAGAALIGLTVAEVVWALTYVAVAEARPWIWLLPATAAVGAAALVARPPTPRRRGKLRVL